MADAGGVRKPQNSLGSGGELETLRATMEESLRYTKSIHELTPKDSSMVHHEIRTALTEMSQYLKATYALTTKIHRWVIIEKVLSIIHILIIVVPIILGIIYIPPLFDKWVKPYIEVLGKVAPPR